MEDSKNQDAVEMIIDGTLDLHSFRPRDIGSLIPEYINECLVRNIYNIRIIHGKGTGALRKGVHSILAKNKNVKEYKLADETGGSWGATLVKLKREE